VPAAPVRADLLQSADVQLNLPLQVALDPILALNDVAEPGDLGLGQIIDARVRINARLAQNRAPVAQPDAKDRRQRIFHGPVARQVHARNTCHCCLSPNPAAACAWDFCR
jgi:hypothetical protein